MSAFDRFAPFIQDYIYAHDWESLRGIQVAAADAVFNTDCNVLLTASTASGKTEAAFFSYSYRVLRKSPFVYWRIVYRSFKSLNQ